MLLLLLTLDESGRAFFHGSRPAPTPRPGQCGLGDHSVRLVRHARCLPPLPHADPYAIFSGCHLGRVALRLGKQVYQGVPTVPQPPRFGCVRFDVTHTGRTGTPHGGYAVLCELPVGMLAVHRCYARP